MLRRFLLVIYLVGFIAVGCGGTAEPEVASSVEEASASVDAIDLFGATASNVFFYYEDVEAAAEFYRETMGFRIVADYGFAKIVQVASKSFITLVDETKGMHSAAEPKTTAIALVTNELDEWWDYIQTQDIEMRSTEYKVVEGRPHHGFVAIDPEGYFLEFERFNAHEENELFMPILAETPTLYAEPGESNVPPGIGFNATIVWFYYKDMQGVQNFYEEVMGFDLLVDQGWAKIYQIGPSGYFGLVDEQRGMHSFTEEKAVTLSIFTDNIDSWYEYLSTNDRVEMRSMKIEVEDEYRAFIAYDPEGYYLEWDVFNDVESNAALLRSLAEATD
jgi:catechol 2,3-dioxygenase-like lactoylglutathione lyase family enzyme